VVFFLAKLGHGLDEIRFRQLKLKIKLAYLVTLLLTISSFIFEYEDFTREGNFFELLTAAFFICSSIILGIKVLNPGKLKRPFLFLGAMIFFVLGMEEISWGQRLFGWETP